MKTIFNFKITTLILLALTVLSGLIYGADASETITNGTLMASTGMVIAPSIDDQDYYTFKEFLRQKGRNLVGDGVDSKPLITKTSLRIEKELSAASGTQYVFNLEHSNNTDAPLERKLKLNEFFMITGIAIGIQKYNVETGRSSQANFPLFTYPDYNYFIAGATPGLEAMALENLYNGNISMKVNGTTLQRDISTRFMKYVPFQQFVNKSVSGQVDHTYPAYGALIEEEGYFRNHSKLIVAGDQVNEIILDIGTGNRDLIAGNLLTTPGSAPATHANVHSADPTQNVAILQLYGFLYSGVAGVGACDLR